MLGCLVFRIFGVFNIFGVRNVWCWYWCGFYFVKKFIEVVLSCLKYWIIVFCFLGVLYKNYDYFKGEFGVIR